MNYTGYSSTPCFRILAGILFALACLNTPAHATMTVSGPIAANNVTVTGDVTVSSITVSSVTVTNLMQVTGNASGLSGSVIQMKSSSTLATFDVTTTTYVAVPLSSSMTLTHASNYVRISLTGILEAYGPGIENAYLTIKRDTTDLGNTVDSSGLAIAKQVFSASVPVGITIVDSPGDTNSHTYQAFIRSSSSMSHARFTSSSVGYLLLEEIHL